MKGRENSNRTRGCLLSTVGLLLAVGAFMYWGIYPLAQNGFGMVTSESVPDPHAFNPIASYAQVERLARQDGESVQLVELTAYYVKSDGTMDLNAPYTPKPNATYQFVRQVPRPADAPPMGAGGANDVFYETITIDAYEAGAWRNHTTYSGNARISTLFMNKGLERRVSSSVTSYERLIVVAPTCDFSQLWEIALTKDAPPEAVATITYNASGYHFTILSFSLNFTPDCRLKQ